MQSHFPTLTSLKCLLITIYLTGFRLGGVLNVLRRMGIDAVKLLVNEPWECREDQLLGIFELQRRDPELSDKEEKAWRNFNFWLKSVLSKYCRACISNEWAL